MWGILIGVGLLDLLFGPFILIGIEQASLTPGISPGFSLDHIDWSHSLAMAAVWSVAYGALFLRLGGRVASIMLVAAFSHFLLDLPMHPADLALWPDSDVHLGLGLWRRLPQGWWFSELAFVAVAGSYYAWKGGRSTRFGGRALAVVSVVLLLHVLNSPWLSAL
jgi:membrane-bound metal-dependent hydrolase YbcI (DUF457 family)